MTLSRILLLVIALIAGGLAAFLATRSGEAPAPTVEQVVVEAASTQVLTAIAPIGVGERLSATNIAWRDWPETAVLSDYISIGQMPKALEEMLGTVARFEIFEGDPIRQQKLVRTDQGYLSAVLDKGRRGVSIGVTADSASGGFIVPNDHVDVILTRVSSVTGGSVSETILNNVRVLAINTRLGEVGGTGGPSDPENPRAEIFANSAIATLDLDPAQAETVINAGQRGKLSLALRSIVDFKPNPADEQVGDELRQRNVPIRIIRYGVEANVVAGTTTAGAPASVDPASYVPPSNNSPDAAAAAAPVLE
jgi:pilus assembly protein CpaB